jgi:signal transduction histidine kinase
MMGLGVPVPGLRDANGTVGAEDRLAQEMNPRRAEGYRDRVIETLQRACAEAQASSRSKDEFLAMLGHELRNPLSAIRNAIFVARLDGGRSEWALEVAWRQTEQLERLVADIHDISLVEQGRVRLKKRRLPLIEIVECAVETTRLFVEDRGHTLSVSASVDLVRVDGDPLRLEQVVVNLLRNAGKYTDRGGHIELFVERNGAEAVLRVRDNGMGISADMLPRIFGLFFQGERALEHAQGGLGIGLSVVRSLLALHDGRVEAHSDGIGKGAEFVVYLPAVAMTESELPVNPEDLHELVDAMNINGREPR